MVNYWQLFELCIHLCVSICGIRYWTQSLNTYKTCFLLSQIPDSCTLIFFLERSHGRLWVYSSLIQELLLLMLVGDRCSTVDQISNSKVQNMCSNLCTISMVPFEFSFGVWPQLDVLRSYFWLYTQWTIVVKFDGTCKIPGTELWSLHFDLKCIIQFGQNTNYD